MKYFDQWFFKYRFKLVEPLLNGTIYVLTSEDNIPESFKEAKEQMKEEMNESREKDKGAES